MEILGYRRPDGKLGIRNRMAIVYTTHCSCAVAQRLQSLYPEGTHVFGYPADCSLREGPLNKIVALANHSQYGAVLVVGLGREGTEAYMVAEQIAKSGKPVEAVKIEEEGGDLKTIEKGSRLLLRLIQHVSLAERDRVAPADLVVAAECGGSDATSGLASNPIAGAAGDLLIEAGGAYSHEEIPELLGCGEALAARAVTPEVGEEIKRLIDEAEQEGYRRGKFNWSYGDTLGGLTSIDEKSAGCLSKSGSKPLQGILTRAQVERPELERGERGQHIACRRVLDRATPVPLDRAV